MSGESGGVIAVQGAANAKTWPVGDMIRARSKGRLPPVVSSHFLIRAAHWRDAIRGIELGARGNGARGRVIGY